MFKNIILMSLLTMTHDTSIIITSQAYLNFDYYDVIKVFDYYNMLLIKISTNYIVDIFSS